MDAVQLEHWNPRATMPLLLPVYIVPNTHADVVDANITANARLDVPWLYASEPHEYTAVICGGGPSLKDSRDELRALARDINNDFFGLNGAAGWLEDQGISVQRQVIIDAQEITSSLVETRAHKRLYASHVHPETAKYADQLFHLNFDGVEDLLPPEKVAAGGYTLVGGGVSVGITALVVAYVMGYRKMHLFGYDSSNRGSATHAYSQNWNAPIPRIDVEWAGKTYNASMPMKLQAEAFQRFATQLQEEGCEFTVHGDGLLPAMWHEPPTTEREKYQLLWARGGYGHTSPGEQVASVFVDVAKPTGRVIDFGCGSGKGAMAIIEQTGCDVLLTDFTDNCRIKAAVGLPFLRWDLTRPFPQKGDVGFCADVMEHIPEADVETVIANILDATPRAFFQIATVPDNWGETIGQQLHLTVRDHEWWAAKFPSVLWQERTPLRSCFYASKVKNG
jgi:SAM-dependent methyltransferase